MMHGSEQEERERVDKWWRGVVLAVAAAAGLTYLLRQRHARENGQQVAGAPGPPGLPLLGNLGRATEDRLTSFLQLHRQFGDVVRLQVGPRQIYLVNHPDLAKYVLQDNNRNYEKGRGLEKSKELLGEGLLTSEGEFWRRQRRLIQPAFHRQQITGFASTMTEVTADMLGRWEAHAARGEALDVAAEMMRLTLEVVSRTLFSTALTTADIEAVATVMTPLLRHATRRIASPFDFVDEWPTPANIQQQKRIDQLNAIVYRIIGERRRSARAHDDLLGMLMAAQDEETGERMSDEQVRDEVMTLFLAGHETTANLLSFTWAVLSRHTAVRRQLEAEVDGVLRGKTPTADDVRRLPFTNMVIAETLRLYPPAWVIGRSPLADDEIGGYHIPAGSTVLISPYVIHRHPAFWENPEGFDPYRFTPDRSAERPRYAYLPFGGGPRLCIGNNFALMEAALVVAMVTQRYELNLLPGHPVAPEVAFTLRPEKEVMVTLQARPAPGKENK